MTRDNRLLFGLLGLVIFIAGLLVLRGIPRLGDAARLRVDGNAADRAEEVALRGDHHAEPPLLIHDRDPVAAHVDWSSGLRGRPGGQRATSLSRDDSGNAHRQS